MMKKSDLRMLAEAHAGWHISLYMPTHCVGAAFQQDQIRYKNLLDDAEEQLEAVGVEAPQVDALLKPARERLEAPSFWQQQRGGLALFLSANVQRVYQAPFAFEPLVVVARRFHLKPLLPLLSGDGRFYLLALSQEDAQLYEGTPYSLSPIKVDALPESLPALLDYAEEAAQLQFHSSTRAPGGAEAVRPGAYHGHGGADAQDKADMRTYFQRIAAALQPVLAENQHPLVLAGVDYLLPLYREVSDYPQLLETGIAGSPDAWDLAELRAQAWAIVEPRFAQDREMTAKRYRQLAGQGSARATHDLAEIVAAAYFERVEMLFVARDAHRWGTFDPESGAITRHEQRQPRDVDLLDVAAVHTFLNGGALYVVPAEAVPAAAPLAAILRY